MRHARPTACASSAGFMHGSTRKTWSALVRFMPTAPLRIDRRKIVVGGSFWNACIARSRCLRGMEPVMDLYPNPASTSFLCKKSSVPWNCVKTRALEDTSLARILSSSFTSALSLASDTKAGTSGSASSAPATSAPVASALAGGRSSRSLHTCDSFAASTGLTSAFGPREPPAPPVLACAPPPDPLAPPERMPAPGAMTGFLSFDCCCCWFVCLRPPVCCGGAFRSFCARLPPLQNRRKGCSSERTVNRFRWIALGPCCLMAPYARCASFCNSSYFCRSPALRVTATSTSSFSGNVSSFLPCITCDCVCRTMQRFSTAASSRALLALTKPLKKWCLRPRSKPFFESNGAALRKHI
mmetsp:Transcript_5895/g.23317  ORF Transcript_5895/g.23317 Transcript_5895/m.23317 type:complete len:355 (+) Transcript_5895:2338-3402(+)